MDLYDDLMTDELIDQCEQVRSIAKKTWLSSASVSLAHLDNVKAKVYNVGLVDPRDLKATNLRPKTKAPESQLSSAWGSNNSIPDLVHHHGGNFQKPTRPGSAKTSSKLTRPPSGKKKRPQSAKEPIQVPYSTSEVEQENNPGFGVKGAKYDPNGRPPKGFSYTSSVGWVGPPAGLKYPDKPASGNGWNIDFPMDEGGEEVLEEQAVPDDMPRPPHTTPVPPTPEPEKPKRIFDLYIGNPYQEQDDFIQSDSEEEEFGPTYTASQITVSTPTKENAQGLADGEKSSLRLDLPTVEDDYDEIDEVDTERLLAEAEAVTLNLDLKAIISANKHIPESSASHMTIDENKSTNQKVSRPELHSASKARAKNLVSEMIDENGLEFTKPDTENHKKECDIRPSLEHEKSSVKFSENVRTVNITPRNIGRKVEELHHGRKKQIPNRVDSFVDLIEVKNRIEPVLSTSKADLTSPPSSSKSRPSSGSRPPSGKVRQPTKYSTPNNEYNRTHYSNTTNHSNLQTGRPRSGPLNRAPKAITMVTVDYGQAEEKQENKEKVKCKKKRATDDVETFMEALTRTDRNLTSEKEIKSHFHNRTSMDDSEDSEEDLNISTDNGLNTVVKSEPEKNYYEISRYSSMSNPSGLEYVTGSNNNSQNASNANAASVPVIKTTKTLEFNELKPREVTIKSVIDPHALNTKDKENFLSSLQAKVDGRPRSRLRPSSAKPQVSKPSTDDHERPGSRIGFVPMVPSKHVSGKPDQTTKKFSRPSSAPVQRSKKPSVKETKTEVHADKENTSYNKIETLADQKKDEREKVIDNLLDRTKTLLQDCDKKLELEESKPEVLKTRSVRPASAHIGLSAGTKDTQRVQSAAAKRPVSATTSCSQHRHYASYSHGSSSVKPKKTSGKTKPKVILTEPCIIKSNTPYFEEETEEDLACQDLQKELANKGVNIAAETLQRALYPPSGKSKYYQITADLPRRTSLSLLSHPKVWLPQEYKRLQMAEKTLARANETMYLQKKAEERRARLEAMTPEERKKMKKKGKKGKKGGKKLRKSQNLG